MLNPLPPFVWRHLLTIRYACTLNTNLTNLSKYYFEKAFFLIFNALCTFINVCLKIVLALKNHLHSTQEGGGERDKHPSMNRSIILYTNIYPLTCLWLTKLLSISVTRKLSDSWCFVKQRWEFIYNNEVGLGFGRSNWPPKYLNSI